MSNIEVKKIITLTVNGTSFDLTAEDARALRDQLLMLFPLPPVFVSSNLRDDRKIVDPWPYSQPPQYHVDKPKWSGSPPEIICRDPGGITEVG